MSHHKINPAIISLIIVVLIGAGVGIAHLATREPDQAQPETRQPASQDTDSSDTTTGAYSNGTYTATGSYSTPGGSETITVTVTLANDTISNISATGSATSGNSRQYQSQFLSGYESQVSGRSINEVSLSRVAGSSLTSAGFNRAIEIIKNDARN